MKGSAAMQGALRRRVDAIDQEIADLQVLLAIMREIDRDAAVRERLRTAELNFRLQDVWSGRLTGDALRGALDALEGVTAARTA